MIIRHVYTVQVDLGRHAGDYQLIWPSDGVDAIVWTEQCTRNQGSRPSSGGQPGTPPTMQGCKQQDCTISVGCGRHTLFQGCLARLHNFRGVLQDCVISWGCWQQSYALISGVYGKTILVSTVRWVQNTLSSYRGVRQDSAIQRCMASRKTTSIVYPPFQNRGSWL